MKKGFSYRQTDSARSIPRHVTHVSLEDRQEDRQEDREVRNFCERNFCDVNLGNIQSNFEFLSELAGDKKVLPMLKANAYGH